MGQVTVLLAFLLGTTGAQAAQTLGFQVTDLETGASLMNGEETIVVKGDGVSHGTRYVAAGKTLATESYEESDGGILHAYRFDDLATGERVEIERASDGRLRMLYVAKQGDKASTAMVSVSNDAWHGKAIPQLILAQWAALAQGRTIVFDLIVAQRLETITFRIRKERDAAGSHGKPTFIVEANNWVIRQFAPRLVFKFDGMQSRRLVEFVGPAAVEIGGEKYRPVRMSFSGAKK